MNWILTCCLIVLAFGIAEAKRPNYDFYVVTHAGDTVREGIVRIFMGYEKNGYQVARVRYEDGSLKRLTHQEIRAFSFIQPRWEIFQAPSKVGSYYQVETVDISYDFNRPVYGQFYQRIDACNGHTFYFQFVAGEWYREYVVAEGKILKYKLDGRDHHVRESIQKLMPECYNNILKRIWPKWAEKHYSRRPVKP